MPTMLAIETSVSHLPKECLLNISYVPSTVGCPGDSVLNTTESQSSGEEEKAWINTHQVAMKCHKEKIKRGKGIEEGRGVILDRMARKVLPMEVTFEQNAE